MSCTSGAMRAGLRLGNGNRVSSHSISQLAILSSSTQGPGPFSFLQRPNLAQQRRRRQFILASRNSIQRSHYSSESAAQKLEPKTTSNQQPSPPPSKFSPSSANPPSTTRPPPLETPTREPNTSGFQHLFRTGKAYLTFYKNGLKNIYHNTRLLYPSSSSPQALQSLPQPGTRSHHLLRVRWAHDMRRLPIFVLLFVVCGEFTPFVVVALPSVVPLTCRIPQHVAKLRRQLEERRARSLADRCHHATGDSEEMRFPAAHLARSLGLVSGFWDRVGWVPRWLAQGRAERRLRFLAEDSRLLFEAGGVPALEDEEVRLACVDRGIDVTGRDEEELRGVLGRWLLLAVQHGGGEEESVMRMVFLLTRAEGEWPEEV